MAPVACLFHAQTWKRPLRLRSFLLGFPLPRCFQSKPIFSSTDSCFPEPGLNLGRQRGLHFVASSLGTTRLLCRIENFASHTCKSYNTAGVLSSLEENQRPIQEGADRNTLISGITDGQRKGVHGKLTRGMETGQHGRNSSAKNDNFALITSKKLGEQVNISSQEMKQATLEASSILVDSFIREPANEQVSSKGDHVAQHCMNAKEDEGSAPGRDTVTNAAQKAGLDMGEKPRCIHPWPEWVEFLEHLYAKNYFEGSEKWAEDGKSVLETYSVRHAIVAFSRERNDIFRSLTRKNLRMLANFGCPDTEKKSSNSSKRLRAHFDIPEGEVCQKCRFKMSCPRAFLPPPTKIDAVTLDVLRIITSFAGNASPNAESFTSYPKEVEVSICASLKEILAFSAIPRDPTFPKESLSWEPIKKTLVEPGPRSPATTKDRSVYTVAEKPGDWVCSNCDFMNFARNKKCRECDVFRPRQEQEILLGDWECPKCKFLNFSKNKVCRECETERPTKIQWTGGERLPEPHIAEKTKGKTSWGSADKRSRIIKQDDARVHSSRSKNKYAKEDTSETDDDMQVSGIESFDSASGSDEENVETLQSSSRAAKRKNPIIRSEEKGLYRQLPADKGIWQPNLTKRKVTMRKDAEKDYAASDEDAEHSDMDSFDTLEMQGAESEFDFSDEEDEALSQSALKIPRGKVTNASFRQSNDKGKKEKAVSRSPLSTRIVGSKVSHKWTDKPGQKATTQVSKASKGNSGKSSFNETDSDSEDFDRSQSKLKNKKSRLGQSTVKSGSQFESVGSFPSNETNSDAEDHDYSESKLRNKNSRLVQSNIKSGRQVKGVSSFPSSASEDRSYNVFKSATTLGAKPLFNWSESESDELEDGRKKRIKGKHMKEAQVQSAGRKVFASAGAGHSHKSGARGKSGRNKKR